MQQLLNQRVTVAGLGHFGGQVAAARWLVEQGARVLVTDQAPAEKLADSLAQLAGVDIDFQLGGHRTQDFTDADLVVASPAIPLSNPFLAAARDAGVPITTEICLFVERCPASIVGVTGTKGKSTTTALLGEMLKSRFTTWVGGNIGRSLLPELGKIDARDIVVLELSSYMLEHLGMMRWSPHVGVVTMIAADHLEWHGGLAPYTAAKGNIVRYQRADDVAVLNEENAAAMALAQIARGRVIAFGLEGRRPFSLLLPGRHNQLNAQAAYAAADALGLSWDDAQHAIANYPGLAHRLELVHTAQGVQYYNDSIATIPEAAVAALQSFPPRRVIQIIGGYDHHLPITAMCNALIERAKAVLCIGQTGEAIADLLSESTQTGGASIYRCGDLKTAVEMARQIAAAGDIVLLSTGYKSYDQFANFEKRGEAFAKLARGG
ncbi:MAG TPA: UDP-N-acetylmuramoyl-L-alanine--D-glutamate ligase [Tepidisphaeraceae bacterium]|jgi:UDP-N-acetylmuramoylalanine--D-glutamate ligase|nr:UDP-N-acetylmuramoyl-L-alanine--D-glutamate ligase [Tepidisphaeraceae bacterium]